MSKYPQQGHFCVSVVSISLLDGTAGRRKLKVYDYTGKRMLTSNDYEVAIKKCILGVRNLKNSNSIPSCVDDLRPTDSGNYEGYTIQLLPRIGKQYTKTMIVYPKST